MEMCPKINIKWAIYIRSISNINQLTMIGPGPGRAGLNRQINYEPKFALINLYETLCRVIYKQQENEKDKEKKRMTK